MLPPGPNNRAGVIWIALNKKGIGIHGASDPDSIGRNASHGCTCRLSKERRCSHLLRYNAAPLSEDAAHPNSLEEAIYERLS